MNILRCLLITALTTFMLTGCGTEDTLSTPPESVYVPQPGDIIAGSITLTASSSQINSGSGDLITLTATVKDTNNVLLTGATVTFSSPAADNADLAQLTTTTDAAGQVTGTVGSVDPTNRIITITASTESRDSLGNPVNITASKTITIIGTEIAINGTSNLSYSQVATLTVSLTDSLGVGIADKTVTLASTNPANVLSASSVITNSNGQAAVSLTAGATDTITATALGATASFPITVSPDSFLVSMASEINISTCEPVTATWQSSGVGVVGQPVLFLTTRGSLFTDASCTTAGNTALTNGTGIATIYTFSGSPGLFTITADATSVGGPQSSADSEYVATVPATIDLQVEPATIATNSSATLTATVKDSNTNEVKNATVDFRIVSGTSGDDISPSSDITDSLGRALSVYISSNTPSATNGIILEAKVRNTSIVKTVPLTVSGVSQSMAVSLANEVVIETPSSYALDGTVIVNDSGGNPVADANIDVKLVPISYDKGIRVKDVFTDIWEIESSVLTPMPSAIAGDLPCTSEDKITGIAEYDLNGNLDTEDINGNSILDAGEDLNGNGVIDFEDYNGDTDLTPNGVGAVDTGLVTNESGFATFKIHYPKDYAGWTRVMLEFTLRVTGSESVQNVYLTLPAALADITGDVNIVGSISPFGSDIDCSLPD